MCYTFSPPPPGTDKHKTSIFLGNVLLQHWQPDELSLHPDGRGLASHCSCSRLPKGGSGGVLFVRKCGWLNRSAWSVFAEPATLFRQGQAHTWRLEFYQRHIYHDFTSAPQWQIGQEFLWSPSCSKDETFFFFFYTKKNIILATMATDILRMNFGMCIYHQDFRHSLPWTWAFSMTDKTAFLTKKIPFYCREDLCWRESHWKTGEIMKIPLCSLQ